MIIILYITPTLTYAACHNIHVHPHVFQSIRYYPLQLLKYALLGFHNDCGLPGYDAM
jgi:hypothetical protein